MKLKKLIYALAFLVSVSTARAQQKCPCNCSTQTMPAMVITDYQLSSDREMQFKTLKRKFLMSNFREEIPINLKDLKTLFGRVANKGASGIRIYFIQETGNPHDISLIFVPTSTDPDNKGWHIDQADQYLQLKNGLKEATLSPITLLKARRLATNYANSSFKHSSELDTSLHDHNRKETSSLFYAGNHIKQLYDAIETGCLTEKVASVSLKFVAYRSDESLPGPDGKLKPMGNQLLLHFAFYDCDDQPVDFLKCYGASAVGSVDTGLPCPDFCVGTTLGLLKK